MPPFSDEKLIEDALQDFSQGLHSDLPLRHFGEFHDQQELKKVVELQKEKVLRSVIGKVWTRDKEEIFALLMKVNRRMEKEVIGAWVKKNQEHEFRSVSFSQKWVDMLCENFNEALEYQLLLNPDMEPDTLKNYVQRRKQIVTSCFESIWKPGTSQMQEERKKKLEKQLQALEDEVFEMRQRILKDKSVDEGRKLLVEVRTILFERSRQLKSYVVKHQGRVSNDILRGMVEEMREYLLNGKGNTLRESREEIFSKLTETVECEIKFLNDDQKKTPAEDVKYAERFDDKLRSCFFDNPTDMGPEMQQDRNGRDSNEEPRRSITMLEILNEFKHKQLNSLDLEENETNGPTQEGFVEGNNDANTVYGEVSVQSTGDGNTQRNPSLRKKRSGEDTDTVNSTMTSGATVPEAPPSKKLRSGRGAAKQRNARVDGGIHRRLTRAKKAEVSKSMPALTRSSRRNNPRTREILDLTEKVRRDVGESSYTFEDSDIVRGDSMVRTPSSSSPPSFNTKKCGKDSEVSLKGRLEKPESSKTTRETTGRRSSRRSSSEGPKDIPKRLKVCQAKKTRCSDDKVCPKRITVLEGDGPKYLCNVCKRKFNTKMYLKYHGEFCGSRTRSFFCDECSKEFYWQCDLDRHIRVHTGEKPFQCPNCPDRFNKKWNLEKHIRNHANDSLYACKPCNLKFVSGQSLHEHNSSNHEGKLPIACCYCDKRFNRRYMLRNHVLSHGDERPFECTKCGVSFFQMKTLVTHFECTHDVLVNHVIKKANLRLFENISVATK